MILNYLLFYYFFLKNTLLNFQSIQLPKTAFYFYLILSSLGHQMSKKQKTFKRERTRVTHFFYVKSSVKSKFHNCQN